MKTYLGDARKGKHWTKNERLANLSVTSIQVM